ncbi:potassium-transporting ATPase subunit KdpC [Sphingosinicella soli]|uniref:Potassium-transporting ATPase KdpC subunit n=1 Tax=Sphingosinicella soli TaxID=333708 RepID=A0A7W7AYL5_9SPHN|nr:potassium-transporting ATPase subunit KdpC [Sphingosinicella soli]MBB4630781.1 K+-transporting ATPase ATPase C chain [Sphingosinicella soli]
MLSEIRNAIRPAIVLLLLLAAILGLAYPLAMTGIAQVAMPFRANGSMIRENDRIVGSALIGQNFAQSRYFHPRPSAAGENGYDAGASAASNLAPGSQALRDDIDASMRAQGLTGPSVPADLVTSSASGLDPHISPEAAFAQAARVAAARNLPVDQVRQRVTDATEMPLLGFLGEPRVNVLLINRHLDEIPANSTR